MRSLCALVVLFILCFILGVTGCVSVGATEVGVVSTFGKVDPVPLDSGIHWINPFSMVTELSTVSYPLQEEDIDVPTKGGLAVRIDATLIYHIDRTKAPVIYKQFGDHLLDTIKAQFRSDLRNVCAKYEPEAVYAGDGAELEHALFNTISPTLLDSGVIVERILLRDRMPPPSVRESIEAKNKADQDAQRMTFTLQKEKQEAERKKIEAQGIADFQRIVSEGITPTLLEWKAIEVSHQLATSTNSKVVLIGRAKDGLPIMLDLESK